MFPRDLEVTTTPTSIYFFHNDRVIKVDKKSLLLTLQNEILIIQITGHWIVQVADPIYYFNQLLTMYLPSYDVDFNMLVLVMLEDST